MTEVAARSPRTQRGVAAGTALVALAASLWATDVLFRRGLVTQLSATEIVFWEHVVLALSVLPILWRSRARLRRLRPVDWLACLVVGGGSSVAATILFTRALTIAFAHQDVVTPLALQKLQPVFAVCFAGVLLGERIRRGYLPFLGLALVGSYLLMLDEPGSLAPSDAGPPLLAVGAAVLWALGTVLGKHLGTRLRPAEVTGVRFACGLPVAAVLLVISQGHPLLAARWGDAPSLVGLALVPGLIALVLYYRGLERTTASTATLAELAYPAAALVVSVLIDSARLDAVQIAGLVLLIVTVTAMPLAMARDPGGLARRTRRGALAAPVSP